VDGQATGFKTWLVERRAGEIKGRFAQLAETDLDDGDVLVRVGFASLGRRDALACTGRAATVRRFPCVGGSDLAGEVLASASPRFCPGDLVLSSGYGLGVKHHGGYAELALLPGGWLLPLPKELSLLESMVFGSSGLAVVMAVTRLEDNGLKPERGPILVTGASGNCGSLAVALLAARGYEVVALTARPELHDWLVDLGASKVLLRDNLRLDAIQPKERGIWAGAIDNLGGAYLPWIVDACKPGACVVALGDVAGSACHLSLDPCVTRGVSVLGVDSVQAGFACKECAWARLSGDLQTGALALLYRVVAFEALPLAFEELLNGHTRGRTVVRIANLGRVKEDL